MKKRNFIRIFLAIAFLLAIYFFVYMKVSYLTFKEGVYDIQEDYIVQSYQTLYIEPGVHFFVSDGVQFIIQGNIIAQGTKEKPIIFESKNDNYWRGIRIEGNQVLDIDQLKENVSVSNIFSTKFFQKVEENILTYCQFKNLATSKKFEVSNREKSVIESYGANLRVENSLFENVLQMGGVQVENAYFWGRNNIVSSPLIMKVFHLIDAVFLLNDNSIIPYNKNHQIWSDGIYSNEGIGIIAFNNFKGLTDDAIDLDKSLAFIIKNSIKTVGDDAIDIDKFSEAYLLDNSVSGVAEDGVLVSDNSLVYIQEQSIEEALRAITLRAGGKAFVENSSISNSENALVLYPHIPLFFTEENFEIIRKRVKNLSQEDIDYWGFYSVKNSSEAEGLLLSAYEIKEGYRILKTINFHQDLKNLFKLVNIFEFLDPIPEHVSIPRSNYFNNVMYLQNSSINNNQQDIISYNPFYLKLDNVDMSSKNITQKIYSSFDYQGDELSEIKNKAKKYFNELDSLIIKLNISAQ